MMEAIPTAPFRFLDLPNELQFLIVEQAILEQRTDHRYEDTSVVVINCDVDSRSVRKENANDIVTTRSISPRKTTRCNALLLVNKKLKDLYEQAAPNLQPVALRVDQKDMENFRSDDDATHTWRWRRAHHLDKVMNLRLEVIMRPLAGSNRSHSTSAHSALQSHPPALHTLARLLTTFTSLTSLDIVNYLPVHGHFNVDAATQVLLDNDSFINLIRCIPTLQRVRKFVAHVCYEAKGDIKLTGVVMWHQSQRDFYARSLAPFHVEEKWLCSAVYPSTQPDAMVLSPELLGQTMPWDLSVMPSNLRWHCNCV